MFRMTLIILTALSLAPVTAHAKKPDAESSGDAEKKICRYEAETGSFMRKRVCRTKAEMDAMEAQAKMNMDRARRSNMQGTTG